MKYKIFVPNFNANKLMVIGEDKNIHLNGNISEKKYPKDLRLIEPYDVEKDGIITLQRQCLFCSSCCRKYLPQ